MRPVLIAAIAAALISAAIPEDEAGAAVRPLTLTDLVEGADVCVRGTVLDATPAWTTDQSMIHTTVRIGLVETLMGAPADVLEVQVPGGDLDGISIRNGEAPAYAPGEDVVVFLKPDPSSPGRFRTYGWFQGKLTLLGGMVREMQATSWNDLRSDILQAVEAR